MQNSGIPSLSFPGSGFDIIGLANEAWHWISGTLWPGLYWFGQVAVHFLVIASIPAALFFLIGIIYCVEKLKVVRAKEKEKHDTPNTEPAFEDEAAKPNADFATRWQKVQAMLNSSNESDWKQAVIEMDTMLLDVLTGLGYQGDGVGEKLKRVQPGELKALQDAWDAHKVRNDIAHVPGYQLDHHAALQTMHQYRKVFEEFYYI